MRPVDLARPHGLSAQAVRNYEQAGILPPADRSPSGHRRYTHAHVGALQAFLALVPGHGHAAARAILVAVHTGRTADALDLIDRGHAELLAQRRDLDTVERALAGLTDMDTGAHGPLPIGALAHQLGLRAATLRRWERAGLLGPARDASGHRVYDGGDVRDAHIVRQLRRGGHPLARIRPLLDDLREAHDPAAAAAALAERRAALTARSRAMLHGAGLLDQHLHAGPLRSGTPANPR